MPVYPLHPFQNSKEEHSMDGRFMTVKKIFIPTLTLIVIASQLFGCGAATQDEALNMLQQTEGIELEVATPTNETNTTESDESTLERLSWVELGSLETNPDLRAAIDSIFKVTGSAGDKQGIIYETPTSSEGDTYTYDNNNTLDVAIHNYNFRETYDTNQADIATAARNSFIDLDDETDDVAIASALNTYFNLLPDTEDGAANPNETLTRAEVMAAITRAITPVTDDLASDTTFNEAVGTTEYNDFAKELDADAFLSTKDNSLDTTTFTGKMTRGEAIYLLMNKFFPEKLKEDNISKYPGITFTDCQDTATYEDTTSTNAEALQQMLSENKIDTRLYNALVLAANYNIIESDAESNWGIAITRSEFIELLVNTLREETTTMSRFNTPEGVLDMTANEYADMTLGKDTGYTKPTGTVNGYENPELVPQPEDYGVSIKSMDDLPSVSPQGWDMEKHPVYKGLTKTGYMCAVDGLTNKVYYANMMIPTGSMFGGDKETTALCDYGDKKGYDNCFEITYEEAKELFGEPDMSTMVRLDGVKYSDVNK